MLALTFGLRSLIFQGLATWLPAMYVDRGWTEAEAGALAFLFAVSSLPATFVVSWLADRVGSRRGYLVSASLLLTFATVGLAAAPGLILVWAPLVGICLGVLFFRIRSRRAILVFFCKTFGCNEV